MAETSKRPRRRGAGGRAARLAIQQATTGNEAVQGGLSGGRYRPLSGRDMENIHQAALTVLERTGLTDHFDELLNDAADRAPMHTLASVEDVGAYAAFLASKEAARVTGGVHQIDGGYSIIG